MIEMHDMGEKRESYPTTVGVRKSETKIDYPTTYISTKKIPDAEDYDVGDEIELHTINKVVGKRINQDKTTEITLEMRECGIMHKGDMKRMKESGVDKKMYERMKKAGMG